MPREKRTNYTLADRDEAVYEAVARQLGGAHRRLRPAAVAVVWWLDVAEDLDGNLPLGKLKRAGDVDRQLATTGASAYDFALVLNKDAWDAFMPEQQEYVVDHFLSEGALKLRDDGEPLRDQHGRLVTRKRRPPVVAFPEVVERHGCVLRDLERLAKAALVARQGKNGEGR